MKNKLIFLFTVIMFTAQVSALEFCNNKALEKFTILQNGRLKPLLVHASETLKFLTGKTKFGNKTSTQVFCQLSLTNFYPVRERLIEPLIEHVDIKEALMITPGKEISFEEVIEKKSELMLLKKDQVEGGSLDKAIGQTLRRLSIYQNITSGNNWLVPRNTYGSIEDMEPIVNLYSALPSISIARSTEILQNELEKRQRIFNSKFPNTTSFEYDFVKLKLPLVAMLLTLLAIAFLVGMKKITLGLSLTIGTILVQTALLAGRVYISKRAPITNMYETVLFSGYAGLILATVIGHFKKEKMFLIIGLGQNLLSIFMINFSGGMLSASIGPLVPVLRDNFWLSTHVTSIIASYGALALSWVLANIVLVKNRFTPLQNSELRHYS